MKPKPNITLKTLADTQNIGLFLSLKKGLNEVFNKRNVKKSPIPTPSSCFEYSDMLSVIICTTGNVSQVKSAVKSLLNQDFPKDKYEIIIVNNSKTPFDYTENISYIPQSAPLTAPFRQGGLIREHKPSLPKGGGAAIAVGGFMQQNNVPQSQTSPNLRIIDEPTLGLSKARNTGAKEARGEYLLYIDDDAVANENLLSHIYSAFKDHKGFSIIGGQIFLKLPSPTPKVFLENREALWSGYTVPYKHFREAREHYEFPYGACFAIRHSALDLLGGFSEKYGRCGRDFAGGEETALCFKAQQYGFKIGIEPKASVLHCVNESRFTEEHIQKTIRMSILTTNQLCKDGYTPYIWTKAYIDERIRILNREIDRLKSRNNDLAVFYKECELAAFEEIAE